MKSSSAGRQKGMGLSGKEVSLDKTGSAMVSMHSAPVNSKLMQLFIQEMIGAEN